MLLITALVSQVASLYKVGTPGGPRVAPFVLNGHDSISAKTMLARGKSQNTIGACTWLYAFAKAHSMRHNIDFQVVSAHVQYVGDPELTRLISFHCRGTESPEDLDDNVEDFEQGPWFLECEKGDKPVIVNLDFKPLPGSSKKVPEWTQNLSYGSCVAFVKGMTSDGKEEFYESGSGLDNLSSSLQKIEIMFETVSRGHEKIKPKHSIMATVNTFCEIERTPFSYTECTDYYFADSSQ